MLAVNQYQLSEAAGLTKRCAKTPVGILTVVEPLHNRLSRLPQTPSAGVSGFMLPVELATAVEARFSVNLPVMALGECDTVARLSARIVSLLAAGGTEEAGLADDQARQVAALYGDESVTEVYVRTAEELQSGELPAAARMIE